MRPPLSIWSWARNDSECPPVVARIMSRLRWLVICARRSASWRAASSAEADVSGLSGVSSPAGRAVLQPAATAQSTRTTSARRSSAWSLLRLLLLFQVGDLRAQRGLVLRLRIESERHAVERERAIGVSPLGENVAEVLVNRGIARQDLRGIVQILFGELELALAKVGPAEGVEIGAVVRFELHCFGQHRGRAVEVNALLGVHVPEVVQGAAVVGILLQDLRERLLRAGLVARALDHRAELELKIEVVGLRAQRVFEHADSGLVLLRLNVRFRGRNAVANAELRLRGGSDTRPVFVAGPRQHFDVTRVEEWI